MTAPDAIRDLGADVPGWAAVEADGLTLGDAFVDRRAEHAALRQVARRDLGLGRVLDGHRNALERLLHHRPQDVAREDREVAAGGAVPHGVWGADPRRDRPEDGDVAPAALDPGGATVSGAKVFCSGAGLVRRALLLVRDPSAGRAVCALVDVAEGDHARIDRAWFAGDALRTSASHRVVLDRAPVLAVLRGAGTDAALLDEPWFSGDALRTAVTWAGALDAVLDGIDAAARGQAGGDGGTPGEAVAVLVARAHAARATVDRWVAHATAVRDTDPAASARTVLLARIEITERCREAMRTLAELSGSHPIAVAGPAARARRDLDLLLLQHRLTPATVRLGRALIGDA